MSVDESELQAKHLDTVRFCAAAVEFAKILDMHWPKPLIMFLEKCSTHSMSQLSEDFKKIATKFKEDAAAFALRIDSLTADNN